VKENVRTLVFSLALAASVVSGIAVASGRDDAPTGAMVLNCCDASGSLAFANLFLQFTSFHASDHSYAYPAILDSDNYPNGAASLPVTLRGAFAVGPTTCVGSEHPCVLDWQGVQGSPSGIPTPVAGIAINDPKITVINNDPNCPNGSRFVVGSTAYHMNTHGTRGCIEFYLATAPTSGQISVEYLSGSGYGHSLTDCDASGNYAGSGGVPCPDLSKVRIYLAANYALINSPTCSRDGISYGVQPACFNPDFIRDLKALRPRLIRGLDLAGAGSNSTTGIGPPITVASYAMGYWNPAEWAGTTTYNSGSCYTSGSDAFAITLPTGGCTPENMQQVQLQFNHANATTAPTLNGIPIVLQYFGPTPTRGPGAIIPNALWTLTYISPLNVWLGTVGTGATGTSGTANNSGIYPAWPLQIQIALANTINAGLWYPVSALVSDFGTALAKTAMRFMNPDNSFVLEYTNEVFNFGACGATCWMNNLGLSYGFPAAHNPSFSVYALQTRLLFQNVTMLWGSRPGLVRVSATTCCQNDSSFSDVYRLQGADLNTALGYSGYNRAVGISYDYHGSISSIIYDANTGIASLVLASKTDLTVGQQVKIAGVTGTGSDHLNGYKTAIAGTAGTRVDVQLPQGLAIAVAGGTVDTRPVAYIDALAYATYYHGAVLNRGSGYGSAAGAYGRWHSSNATVSGKMLIIAGEVTGNIQVNQGISYNDGSEECDGVYITSATNSTQFELNADCGNNPSGATVSGGDLLGMQYAADNYAGTSPTGAKVRGVQQDALNWIDYDVRCGTQNGLLGNQTLTRYLNHGSGICAGVASNRPVYIPFARVANEYGLPIYGYEGGFEDWPPTTVQCGKPAFSGTALAIYATTYCGTSGSIKDALNAYKKSSMLARLVSDQFNDIASASPPGSLPAWYTFCNGYSPWSLCDGDMYRGFFKSFDAVKAWNERDGLHYIPR